MQKDSTYELLPTDLQRKIDLVCDAFELRWKKGETPSIDEYCKLTEGEFRKWLFHELTILSHRLSQGEKPSDHLAVENVNSPSTNVSKRDAGETLLGSFKTSRLELPMPKMIGRFKPTYELGRGSAGVVYAAIDATNGTHVAIKVPHAYEISSEDGLNRLMREVKLAKLLEHPNVVKLLEFCEDGPGPFLVYEYLNGADLKCCFKLRLQLPLHLQLQIIAQASRALQSAHDLGIVHRDVSPANIMIKIPEGKDIYEILEAEDIHVKLIDFGIARPMELGTLQTKTGAMMGTPAYMSPEQASGMSKEADERSDVYGLGAVMYHMLTGSVPFQGDRFEMLDKIRCKEVPLISKTHPNIPQAVGIICQRCLRLSPSDRYQSINQLADDIECYLQGKPIQAKRVGFAERCRSKWKHDSKLRTVTIFALVMVCCISLTAYAVVAFYKNGEGANNGFAKRTIPSATRQFIDTLPSSASDLNRLSEAIESASVEEFAELATILEQKLASPELQLMELHSKKFGHEGSEEVPSLRREKLECLICAVDPARYEMFASETALWSWIAESVKVHELGLWQQITKPFEAKLIESMEKNLLKENRAPVRLGMSILLSAYYKNEPDKLLAFACQAHPAEISRWSDLLQSDSKTPEEIVPVNWSDFEVVEGYENFSEAYCVEQANRVLIRYAMKDSECLRRSLKHRFDPRLRTYVVHRLVAMETSLKEVILQLLDEKEHDVLFGFLMVLGQLDYKTIESSLQKRCKAWLLSNYHDHPDAGVHSFCRILLDRWQLSPERKRIDQDLIATHTFQKSNKSWFVNSLGMPFVTIRAQQGFWMGNRVGTENLGEFNPRHFQLLDCTYSIALEQIEEDHVRALLGPDAKTELNWLRSIDFCVKLNEHEGISASDIALLSDRSRTAELTKYVGYRLATGVEWEFAARGFVSTPCHFGNATTSHAESFRRTRATESLPFPNQLGLLGLCDFAEFTMTRFEHDDTMVMVSGTHLDHKMNSRMETKSSPINVFLSSSNLRSRLVLIRTAIDNFTP